MMTMMMMMMMIMNCFRGMVDWKKLFRLISSQNHCQRSFKNLQHAACRIWTYEEPNFRFGWIRLYSNDNHYTTVPQSEVVQ